MYENTLTVNGVVGPVLARKRFVCVEQEKQRRAEPVNRLTRLKNQA
jgi:hypothetical protein